MSKIKILVAPGDRSGSGKFRCVDPHVNLQNNFSDDFFVDIDYSINFNDTNYLKKYDALFIHRLPQHNHKEAINIIKNVKKIGLKVIIDTDDHWNLDPSHGSYELIKFEKINLIMLECIKLADLVTTTTEILAKEIRKFNKNVVVLPNALDPNEEQFKPNKTESDLIRIGWLGGSTHLKDLELISDIGFKQETFSKKTQYVLCGFDTRGQVKYLDRETNEYKTRPMRPEETSWFIYETFFTNCYKNIDKEYLTYLMSFNDDIKYNTINKPYRRIWTRPITQYALNYNLFDIALAPLNDSTFNMYKSQLKVIEAGFHKKALIAQNYGPYQIDLINAVDKGGKWNDSGNSLLVDVNKNHKQWSSHIKRLTDNPELITELGEKLYETVKDKYNLNNVTKLRAEIYKNLIK
jgi:glycosyltransferase involved in cell wall biosynthesis